MGDKNAQNSAPASSEIRAKLRKSFSSLRMSLTGKPINSIINEVFEGQLLSEVLRVNVSEASVFIRLVRSAAWSASTAVTRKIRSWICRLKFLSSLCRPRHAPHATRKSIWYAT